MLVRAGISWSCGRDERWIHVSWTVLSFSIEVSTMANQEHVQIIQKGIEAWNQWRNQDPKINPDLREADLHGADLSGADFSGADLSGADLSEADLSDAKLGGASLLWADLRAADLSDADLRRAKL